MEIKRETYCKPVLPTNKWVEDSYFGSKPCVVFDDAGKDIYIILKSLLDSGKDETIKLSFVQCTKNTKNELVVDYAKDIYATMDNVVNKETGMVVPLDEGTLVTEDLRELKENYEYEYLYFTNLFGRESSSSKSIYSSIQDFIKFKFISKGLLS